MEWMCFPKFRRGQTGRGDYGTGFLSPPGDIVIFPMVTPTLLATALRLRPWIWGAICTKSSLEASRWLARAAEATLRSSSVVHVPRSTTEPGVSGRTASYFSK